MNECAPLSLDMLPKAVSVETQRRDLDFDEAKRVADEATKSSFEDTMLLAWFDRARGTFAPQVTCCGEAKPTWLVYAESRGANRSVIVNGGQYVFVYTVGEEICSNERPR